MESFPPESRPVTMRDIGRALGISHVTVSLALRNNPRIPEDRRREVRSKASEMGYHPNAMAAALAQQRSAFRKHPVTSSLAWMNFWSPHRELRVHGEFDAYWRGACRAAEHYGYRLEEFACTNDRAFLLKLAGIFRNRGLSGILLPPLQEHSNIIPFDWDRFFAVRFGSSVVHPPLHLVTADQSANAILAFKKADELGYRRIGFISGGALYRARLSQAGYLSQQYSLPGSRRLPILQLEKNSRSEDLRHLRQWLKSAKPDAIITDQAEAADLLHTCGCRVPDDVGLSTLSVLDGCCDTGINQNSFEIGRLAVITLVSLIHVGERGIPKIPRHTIIEGSWVQGSMMPERHHSKPRGTGRKKRGIRTGSTS